LQDFYNWIIKTISTIHPGITVRHLY